MARRSVTPNPRADATPLISVIISFFDAERYLNEAVASVFAQTWRRWELVLVDDGSTDGSTRMARGYAESNPRIVRYVEHARHVNRGMSASRNVGVAHARGEYLAFLDADDVFLPEKLERQIKLLVSRPDIDGVFNDTLYWYSWSGIPDDAKRDVPRRLEIPDDTVVEPRQLISKLVRGVSFTPATCSVMLRRSAFEKVGGFEESFRGMFEDQAFFYKLFMHCRTYMAGGTLDRYRQHDDSCCAAATRDGRYREDGPSPARRRFLDWFADYLRQQEPAGVRLRGLVTVRRWFERHPTAARLARRTLS